MPFVSTAMSGGYSPTARSRNPQPQQNYGMTSGYNPNQSYNPAQGGYPTGNMSGNSGQAQQPYSGGFDQSVYPGPYGQPNPRNQQDFNANWYNQSNTANPYQPGLDQALQQYQERDWGDWGDAKTAAGNMAYAQAYGNPMLQAQQNARTQAFNEASWAANYNEQQYLNRNANALDWASSAREDAGLNYAITSGEKQFLADQKQLGISNEQAMFNLQTQRAAQQAQSSYNTGQLKNESTSIANQYNIAQAQNKIDSDYKKGLIGVEQYNARTQELKAKNDFTLGTQANANDRYATDIQKLLGLGSQANDKYGIDVQKLLGQESNANEKNKIINDYVIAQKQNQIDQAYKSGLLSNEQYNNETQRLRAENDMTMGMAGINQQKYATDAQTAVGMAGIEQEKYATDKDYDIGLRNADISQYGAQTGRMQVQNQHQIAQGQLILDEMVRTGQLTNDQYQAQTARLQQQSQEQQWQQQLMAQQSQFGQQLAFDRENMAAQLLQSRYNAGGRARNPNMGAYNQAWA